MANEIETRKPEHSVPGNKTNVRFVARGSPPTNLVTRVPSYTQKCYLAAGSVSCKIDYSFSIIVGPGALSCSDSKLNKKSPSLLFGGGLSDYLGRSKIRLPICSKKHDERVE